MESCSQDDVIKLNTAPLVTSHLKKLLLPYSLPDFVQIFTDIFSNILNFTIKVT